MADESISVGWVLAGVGAVVGALAAAVRWLVREKDRQTEERIAKLEAASEKADAKLEKLNTYIRDTLNQSLMEAHQRERRLARIVARYLGDSDEHEPAPERAEKPEKADPAPSDQRDIATEPISKAGRAARKAKDDESSGT